MLEIAELREQIRNMAQFRLSVSLASRGAGRSVVAMAAYRAGSRLLDEKYGLAHDYTRRDGVEYSDIVLPDNAPEWAGSREQLWNRVEQNEKRDNAQLAREVQLSLPHELDSAQRRDLALEFAQHVADEYGFAVDMAIHAPSERGDDRNHHVHLLLTTRGFDANRESGWAKTKDRRFDAIAMGRAGEENAVEDLRLEWETMQNAALERAGIVDEDGLPVRVDRRSYERQGLAMEPTRHEGPEATAIKRSGGESDIAEDNERIRQRNAQREADREAEDRAWDSYQNSYEISGGDEAERSKGRNAQRKADEDEADRAWQSYQNSYEIDDGEDEERRRQSNAQREADREDERAIRAYEQNIIDAISEVHRTPDEDRLRYALRFSDPVQAIFADLDNSDRARTGSHRTGGQFSRTHHTAGDVSEFNKWLATDEDSAGGHDETTRRQPERLDHDPHYVDPPYGDPLAEAGSHPVWRWRGLDALNEELSEPVEDERTKERGGGSDRQFSSGHEVLDTDPKADDPEEWQRNFGPSFGRGR